MRHERGQALSIDGVVALVVFAALLLTIIAYWSTAIASSDQAYSKSRMALSAISAAGLLIKSPGVPFNWEQNATGVWVAGLAQQPNVLSQDKLAAFASLNYTKARGLIGMEKDFYFSVMNENGTVLYSLGDQNYSAGESVGITRIAMLNGQVVKMRLIEHD